ncbi:MAG: ATP synthase subunit C [Candidatus Helarchaeota archaeon]
MKKTASVFVVFCVLIFIIMVVNAVSITMIFVLPNISHGSSGMSAQQIETYIPFMIPIASEANKAMYALAAGISVAGSTIGSGYAIAHVGTSAISSFSEKEENFGKAFLIVSLAEALAIYGLIMGILLWTLI